jgi:uncharacterized protein (TIGR02246 family)
MVRGLLTHGLTVVASSGRILKEGIVRLKCINVQTSLVLIAGALLGYVAASGGFLIRLAPAQASGRADEEMATITFTVRLPADAILLIDDFHTKETGDVRTFQTPPLAKRGHYTYTLKAKSQGKEVLREIHLAHGVDNSFDLRAQFQPSGAQKADPKLITRVGQNDNADDKTAIAKSADAFVDAFHKGDARAVAAVFTTDAVLADENGQQARGRQAIEKRFAELFSQYKGLKLGIESLSLNFITPDVAIEEGNTTLFPQDGAPPRRTKFTNVHVKKDGKWLLSSVKEAAFVPAGTYEKLRALEWALGEWEGQGQNGEREHILLVWADNKNFIVGSFGTTIENTSVGRAEQWIGWDAVGTRIRSWSFDETGAFGEGVWTQDGNQWMIKTGMSLPDGKKATATFVLTPVDADTISLQSKDRTIDGTSLPNTKVVKLKRIK